ncbi:MAG: hypothetical protein [Olavius algarvensis Gamma 1 endosymbiont]|nr:MAG: hypothetical protein [Olavius algarvensis Gamma 1 endosymbiont]
MVGQVHPHVRRLPPIGQLDGSAGSWSLVTRPSIIDRVRCADPMRARRPRSQGYPAAAALQRAVSRYRRNAF